MEMSQKSVSDGAAMTEPPFTIVRFLAQELGNSTGSNDVGPLLRDSFQVATSPTWLGASLAGMTVGISGVCDRDKRRSNGEGRKAARELAHGNSLYPLRCGFYSASCARIPCP